MAPRGDVWSTPRTWWPTAVPLRYRVEILSIFMYNSLVGRRKVARLREHVDGVRGAVAQLWVSSFSRRGLLSWRGLEVRNVDE